MEPFRGAWRGERPLWYAFWVLWVAGSAAWGFALAFSVALAGAAPWLILGALACFFLYLAWALTCVWRCAANSSAGWRWLVRGYVVLFVAGVALKAFLALPAYRAYTDASQAQRSASGGD